jgi:hypothetical protein
MWGAMLCLVALPAAAGTVTGMVRNGTTGQPAAGVEVDLLLLKNGMENVGSTKTDAQGLYRLENADIGQQMMLVRAVYLGVDYLQPIPPKEASAKINIKVYERTANPDAFEVLHHIIAVEPQGGSLLVGEEFDIENKTNPPKSYYRSDGSFEFQLPKGAQLNQVEAWGPSNMPVVQGTVGKGNNRYAIIFPFRPGSNGVRLSFKLNYAGNQATLRLPSLYPATVAMLLAPPTVTVNAAGFSPSGSEHGWSVYSRQGITAGKTMVVSLSGTGPPPSDNGGGSGGAGGAAPVAEVLPPRLNSVRGVLIGGFAALFLLGVFFLWWKSRSTVPAVATAGTPAATPVATPPASVAAQPIEQPNGGQSLRQSVDEIKETLFRLELRRQAGTLPEDEYLSQRQRLEKALRELVRG